VNIIIIIIIIIIKKEPICLGALLASHLLRKSITVRELKWRGGASKGQV